MPLASEPWSKFAAGSKTVEVRRDAKRWGERHVFPGRSVRLRAVYSGSDILGTLGRVYRGVWADAPAWVLDGAAGTGVPDPRFSDEREPIVAFEVVK